MYTLNNSLIKIIRAFLKRQYLCERMSHALLDSCNSNIIFI